MSKLLRVFLVLPLGPNLGSCIPVQEARTEPGYGHRALPGNASRLGAGAAALRTFLFQPLPRPGQRPLALAGRQG
ncbi:MAG TPA: hypothetical protein VF630_03750 [Hymenobacter sp.]|jgi:hypothetical protein